MLRFHFSGLLLCLLSLTFTGCCCVQGVSPMGDCGIGSCASGNGGGPLMGFASCKGGCGEVYVDEWVSEPPTIDNCGYDCGGCGNCGQCQPVRNALRLLWGRPFVSNCNSGLCGPSCSSCDSGGEVFEGGYGSVTSHPASSGCNCGGNHSSVAPIPMQSMPAAPMPRVSPEVVPTPAPEIPSSAKRLNPAGRRTVTQAAARR